MDKDSGQCECHCAGSAFLNVGVGCVFAACGCIVLAFVLCLYFVCFFLSCIRVYCICAFIFVSQSLDA